MFNSKGDLKIILLMNWVSMVILVASFFVLLISIRADIQAYGFCYNVTTTIGNISVTEEVDVKSKFNFAGMLLTIVLINVLNVVHFRCRLNELVEEEDRVSGSLPDHDRSCDQSG